MAVKPNNLLSNVKKSKMDLPPFLIGYGQDGVGKTSLFAQAEDLLFVGPENKTEHLNVNRILDSSGVPINFDTYEKNIEILETILNEKHDYKNICFESIDWLEQIIFKKVCQDDGVDSIVKAHKGYGNGFKVADELTRVIIDLLSKIWMQRKMGVFITAHYQLKEFKDPNTSADYTRYSLKTRVETAGFWREAVKGVYFFHYEIDKGKDDARAYSSGARRIGTKWNASYDAKDHYGVPEFISMGESAAEGYINLISAIQKSTPDKLKILNSEIEELVTQVTLEGERLKKVKAVQKQANDENDTAKLELLVSQLKDMKG